MTDDQHTHRREADGVRGSSTRRGDSLCEGAMSRGEGTCMAGHQRMTTGTTAPAAAQSPASWVTARDAREESGRGLLKRAALYARVSTDKQEREETVASQVDLLQQAAETHGYEVLPGHVFIDDGISGTRLDRPALDRLRDLAAEGAFEVILVTALIAWLAAMPIRSPWSRSSHGVGVRSSSCISVWGQAPQNRCSSRCRASLRSTNAP
jgi:hypothetical protein